MGKQTMNAVLVLKKDVIHLINQYRFIVDIKQKNNTYISIDLNICEALTSSFTNVVIRLISEEIHRVSNFPYECPLKKVHNYSRIIDLISSSCLCFYFQNFRYIINNFTINTKFIPSFTPDLKWYSNCDFYVMQRKVLRFNTYGEVNRKLKRKG